MSGNSFTNWSKITPMQNSLVNKILESPVHIIATMRTKQDYVLNQKDGKFVPEKVGLKAIQRNDLSYEFTLVFDVDIKHNAVASKDRTNLFSSGREFKISEATGKLLLNWCDSGKGIEEIMTSIMLEIEQCTAVEGLKHIFSKYPNYQIKIKDKIIERKAEIENVSSQIIPNKEIVQPSKIKSNGVDTK
jgi:hypothetical protein